MAASITDKITDTRNAARPNSARVTSGRSAGGATLVCDNLAGWPTASKVHFVTYTVDSNSNPVAGSQLDCQGIVSGNSIGSFSVIDGTDAGNAINDYVEMLPTAKWGQDLSDALTTLHNRDGTWKTAAALIQPTIADYTNAGHTHASTAQGGLLNGASAITDGTITPAELATGTGSTWVMASYTPTCVGWSGTPVTTGTSYVQIGKIVIYRFVVSGTSNATSVSVGLPVAARNNGAFNFEGALGLATDNGTTSTTACRMAIDPTSSTTTIACYHDMATGTWTNSGTKEVRGTAIYEAA